MPKVSAYRESDLDVTFPSTWWVRRFDATPAYRSLSGHGLKGVDFICLTPAGECCLVEIKNYRLRPGRPGQVGPRRTPAEVAAHVNRKFADSERIVRIADAWVGRWWWRRLGRWWPNSAARFWYRAAGCVRAGRVVRELRLLLPEGMDAYRKAVTTDIRGRVVGHE